MRGSAALVVAGLAALAGPASAQGVSVQVAVCGQRDPALVPRSGVVPVVVTLSTGAEGAAGPVLVETLGYAGRRRAAWVLPAMDLPPGSRKAVEAFLPLEGWDLAVRAAFPHGSPAPSRGACRTRHVATGLGPVAVFREPSEAVPLGAAQPIWPREAELLWPRGGDEGPPLWKVVEPDASLLPRDPKALVWACGIAAIGAPEVLTSHRDALADYVRRGGRLLWAPGASGLAGAPPAGLLPVEVAGELREAPLEEVRRFLGGSPDGPPVGPAVLWKPLGGRVRAFAGVHPVAVEDARGLGRVLAVGVPPGSRAAREADLAPGLVGWLVGPPPASVVGPRAEPTRTEIAGALAAPPADPVSEAALAVASELPRPAPPAEPVRLAAALYVLVAATTFFALRRRPALAGLAAALLATGGVGVAAGPGFASPRRAVAAAGFSAVEVASGESRGRLEALWVASAERGGALPLEGAPEDAAIRCLEAPLNVAGGAARERLPLPAGTVTFRISGTTELSGALEADLEPLTGRRVRLRVLNGTPWTLGSGLLVWRGRESGIPAVPPGEGKFEGPLSPGPYGIGIALGEGDAGSGLARSDWPPGLDHPAREGLRLAAHGASLADPSPILLFELGRADGTPRPGLPGDRGEAWLVARLPVPVRTPIGLSGFLEGPEALPAVRCLPDGDPAALRAVSLTLGEARRDPSPREIAEANQGARPQWRWARGLQAPVPDEEPEPVPLRAVHPLSGREIPLGSLGGTPGDIELEDPAHLLDERGVLRLRLGDIEKQPWRTPKITGASSGWPTVRLRGRAR